jgi:2'-5' RNA ligase
MSIETNALLFRQINVFMGRNLQDHRGLPEVHRATAHFEPITLKFVGQTKEETMEDLKNGLYTFWLIINNPVFWLIVGLGLITVVCELNN